MWDAATKDRARGSNNELCLPVREKHITLVFLPFKSNRNMIRERRREEEAGSQDVL